MVRLAACSVRRVRRWAANSAILLARDKHGLLLHNASSGMSRDSRDSREKSLERMEMKMKMKMEGEREEKRKRRAAGESETVKGQPRRWVKLAYQQQCYRVELLASNHQVAACTGICTRQCFTGPCRDTNYVYTVSLAVCRVLTRARVYLPSICSL